MAISHKNGLALTGLSAVNGVTDLSALNGVSATLGGGSATLLLDALSGADAAWSVARRLRAAYSGNCLQVRRASDDTTQNIGFSGDALDTAALTSFCSGTDGYVSILYDQSGNGRNLEQATTGIQPQIVASGSVITGSDGKPTIYFSQTRNDRLFVSRTLALPVTWFGLVKNRSTVNDDILWSGNSTTRTALKQASTGPAFRIVSGVALLGPTYSNGTWYVVAAHFLSSGTGAVGINAASRTSGSVGTNAITGFAVGDASVCADFDISELVVYPSDVGGDTGATPATGDDATVINNMNGFYSVF
jgi:hypothetical protein